MQHLTDEELARAMETMKAIESIATGIAAHLQAKREIAEPGKFRDALAITIAMFIAPEDREAFLAEVDQWQDVANALREELPKSMALKDARLQRSVETGEKVTYMKQPTHKTRRGRKH